MLTGVIIVVAFVFVVGIVGFIVSIKYAQYDPEEKVKQ